MRLAKKTKPKKKKSEDIEEIEAIPEVPIEEKMRDVERSLALAEERIRQLDNEIDTKADKLLREKIQATYDGFGNFLMAAEARILQRLMDFMHANPAWEYKQVSKTSVGAEFYNPASYLPQLQSQGWRWIGQGYDMSRSERYDYFIRPKKMNIEKDALIKMYSDFHAAQAAKKPVSEKAKSKVKLRLSLKK